MNPIENKNTPNPQKSSTEEEFLNKLVNDSGSNKDSDFKTKNLSTRSNFDLETYINGVPPRFRGLLRRVHKGMASPRQVIRAKCYECCNFEDVATRISTCTSVRCPLHPYRKVPRPKMGTQDEST